MHQSSDEIISLIDEIEDIVQSGKTPFTGGQTKRIVEAEEILSILDEIRDRFPQEFNDARRVLKEQNEIIIAAQNQANAIIADAQQQAMILAGDQEIVRLAQQQADDIRMQAQNYERDTRYNAEEYAEYVLAQLEENLKSLTNQVARVRQTLDESSRSTSQNVGW